MALSRYEVNGLGKSEEDTPSFRQACEFDFFRGQSGSRLRPDIFNDGTLSEQPFKKLKAFTDVGNVESMSKERWGAAKWVKGQPRLYCVNDFGPRRLTSSTKSLATSTTFTAREAPPSLMTSSSGKQSG